MGLGTSLRNLFRRTEHTVENLPDGSVLIKNKGVVVGTFSRNAPEIPPGRVPSVETAINNQTVEETTDQLNNLKAGTAKTAQPGVGDAGSRGTDGKLIKSGTDISPAEVNTWNRRLENVLGTNAKTKLFLGLSGATMLTIAGVYLGCTDGVTVNISTIAVVPSSVSAPAPSGTPASSPGAQPVSGLGNKITFAYSQPSGVCNGSFNPCKGDTVTFSGTSGCSPTLDGLTGTIEEVSGANIITVALSISVTTTGTGTAQATFASSFENQVAGLAASVVATVANAAAAVANAADNAFCTAVPLLCDIKWIIGIVVACVLLIACVIIVPMVMK